MRKKILIFTGLSVAAMSVSAAIFARPTSIDGSSAYVPTPLTSYIDLNRVDASDIRSYYSSLENLTGKDTVLAALKTLLSTNQQYYKYDDSPTIFKMYEIIDRDWKKSPASAITNGIYDPVTNTISNYQYGSNDNHLDNPYLHSLYVSRDIESPKTAWGNHDRRDNPENIEREHIWPKSHGFDEKGQNTGGDASEGYGGARGDPMHLFSADGHVNGIHSNNYYGNVDKTKPLTDCGVGHSITPFNYYGVSETLGVGKVFEPQDSDKGDIARACFYMASRYNNVANNDDHIGSNNPNLCLDDTINNDSGVSTADNPFSLGILSDLLEWNELDPVDDFEIYRNDLLFNNYTNNRNPFIDFPEWANYIWGDEVGTSLKPSTDPLHGNTDDTISLTLSNKTISITDLETASISAKTSDGNEHIISWEVEDSDVISISSPTSSTGLPISITALSVGTSYLTASVTIDGDTYTKTAQIIVRDHRELDTIVAEIVSTDYDSSFDPTHSVPFTKDIRIEGDLSINYSGVTTRTSTSTSDYSYGMYNKDLGFIYNTTAPSGYYPSDVIVEFTGGTSTNGMVGVIYDDEILDEINPDVSTPVVKSGILHFENTNSDNIYWNLSTANYNVQIKKISVVYLKMDPEISFDKSSLTGLLDEVTPQSDTVSIICKNLGSANKTFTWESGDSDICTVVGNGDSATITYVGLGSTSVSCEVTNGVDTLNTSIPVSVTRAPLELVNITSYDEITNFTAGDAFIKSPIRATYNDTSTKVITYDCDFGNPDMTLVGEQTINVSYSESDTTKTTSYTINIVDAPYIGIRAVDPKLTYQFGEEFVAPSVVSIQRNGTYIKELPISDVTFSTFDKELVGAQIITATATIEGDIYNTSFEVTVVDVPLDHLEIRQVKTIYEAGEQLSDTKIVAVFINAYNYIEEDITNLATYDGFDTEKCGLKTVVVSYTVNKVKKSISYDIVVYEKPNSGFSYVNTYDTNGTPLNVDEVVINQELVATLTPDIGTNPYSSNVPTFYTNDKDGAAARFYFGNTLTVSSIDGKKNIAGIRFVFGKGDETNQILSDKGSVVGNIWKPNPSTDGKYVDNVIFTIDGNKGQRRITSIKIYYYTCEDYVLDFLRECSCDISGDTRPNCNWEKLGNMFNDLYGFEQEYLREGEGSVIGSNFDKMLSRYDYIVWKYGNEYDNFMNRNIVVRPSFSGFVQMVDDQGNLDCTLIIIITSVVSLTAVGGYLLLRKKKEN